MAVTQADLDTVTRAIATGERRVKFSDGREVEYRSVADLRDALALLRTELNATGAPADRDIMTSFERD
jgi:hypothetical protein